jgi:hypothetical protein
MIMVNNEMIATDGKRVRKPKIPKKKYLRRPQGEVTNSARSSGGKAIIWNFSWQRSMTFCPKCGSLGMYWASRLPQLWSVWDSQKLWLSRTFVLWDSKLAKKLKGIHREKHQTLDLEF